MRQGQQHRRGRGRGGHNANHGNNNARKIQNPLSRTYHSNGPDGKVSGSPQSIADKYLSLARDALSSGDPVLAENYLQHAEHYNRIILAYREQVAQAQDDGMGGQRPRPEGDVANDFPDEETDTLGRDLSPLPPEQPRRQPEQSRNFEPREGGAPDDRPGRFGEGGRHNEGRFNDRQRPPRDRYGERGSDRDRERDRFGDRDRDRDRFGGGERFGGRSHQPSYGPDGQPLPERNGERPRDDRPRDDRPREDRMRDDRGRDDRPRDDRRDDRGRDRDRPFRQPNGPRFDAPPREPVAGDVIPEMPRAEPAVVPVPEVAETRDTPRPAPRRRERGPALAEESQPDFLRRPVRRPRREAVAEEAAGEAAAPVSVGTPSSDRDGEAD